MSVKWLPADAIKLLHQEIIRRLKEKKIEIFGNIGSKHHQIRDDDEQKDESTSEEQENFLILISVAYNSWKSKFLGSPCYKIPWFSPKMNKGGIQINMTLVQERGFLCTRFYIQDKLNLCGKKISLKSFEDCVVISTQRLEHLISKRYKRII